MKTLQDFNGAFIGWRYHDWKINYEKPYLDDNSAPIVEDTDNKNEFSDEKTIKALQRRYKKMYSTSGHFTYEQWKRMVNYYCGPERKCLKCGEVKFIIPDHITSASIGGDNSIENIQPICLSCNSEKRTEIVDFRPDKGSFAQILSYL